MGNFRDWWDENHSQEKMSPEERAYDNGEIILDKHPLFGQLRGYLSSSKSPLISKNGACVVSKSGRVNAKYTCNLTPDQWAYTLAHCLLHLAFGHFDNDNIPMENETFDQALWNKACDIYVTRFLFDIKFGDPICPDPALEYKIKLNDESKIYAHLKYLGDVGSINPYGTNGNAPDMLGLDHPIVYRKGERNRFAEDFVEALNRSVNNAVSTAGGHTWNANTETPIKKAAEWFLTHYPLLGGLAASFQVIEDVNLCMKNEIHLPAWTPCKARFTAIPPPTSPPRNGALSWPTNTSMPGLCTTNAAQAGIRSCGM